MVIHDDDLRAIARLPHERAAFPAALRRGAEPNIAISSDVANSARAAAAC